MNIIHVHAATIPINKSNVKVEDLYKFIGGYNLTRQPYTSTKYVDFTPQVYYAGYVDHFKEERLRILPAPSGNCV